LVISIFEETSKDEKGLNSLRKAPGILTQIYDFVEIYSSNKVTSTQAFEIIITIAHEIDFGDKKEILPEQREEYLSFVLKKLEESKNELWRCLLCFRALIEMCDEEYAPEISTANSRMMSDVYQSHLPNDKNDEFLKLVFECFGKLALDNKNRQTFAKQQITENLKKLYKTHSKKPDIVKASKDAKKNLGIA
jgi:hypothetical protein